MEAEGVVMDGQKEAQKNEGARLAETTIVISSHASTLVSYDHDGAHIAQPVNCLEKNWKERRKIMNLRNQTRYGTCSSCHPGAIAVTLGLIFRERIMTLSWNF